MSDKARELLERAIEEWDSNRDIYEFHKVIEEIRAYLAQPEVKPLSLAEISAAYLAEIAPEYPQADADEYKWMVRGVRFAEKHHGIGGRE